MYSMRITRDIFHVGGDGLTAPGDGSIYLIHFDGPAALLDAGSGHSQDRLFRNIEDCGVELDQIRYLLVTHCHFDHTGGIRGVKARTRCEIVAHELDARYLEEGNDIVTGAEWYGSSLDPTPIDIKWTGDENEITLGEGIIKAFHVPGHSPGSLVYLTESQGLKVLFGQDVHGPINEEILLSNREDYNRSLKFMLSLEADILCEGHYGIFRGKREVEDFIRSFL